jgi:hypothetical protein
MKVRLDCNEPTLALSYALVNFPFRLFNDLCEVLLRTGAVSARDRMSGNAQLDSTFQMPDSSSPEQERFWEMVQTAARDALRSALGDIILGVLTGQKMLENPERVLEFTERLQKVFGVSGAKTLEFIITKDLYNRLGLPFNPDGIFNYESFLVAAKNDFLAHKDRLD